MQYHFGSGTLYGRKLGSATPTPVQFGAIQGVSIDIAFTQKELYGSKQFPVAIARGTGKITGKAQFGQFNAQMFNDLFFNEESDPSTGRVVTVTGELSTVASNAVTVDNNATFLRDLGVISATTGLPYTRVASGPVGLQYAANETTGVYSFNSSQNDANVKISYQYTDSGNGKTIVITNKDLGDVASFMVVLSKLFNGKRMTLTLNSCTSAKLMLATKLEDFVIPDFDFAAQADESDEIGRMSLDE